MLTSFFSKHIDAHAPFFFFFLFWIHEWEGDLPGWSGWLSLHCSTSSGCNSSGTILCWPGDPTVSAMQNIRGETKAASHQGEHYFPAALWHPLASCGLGTSSSPGGRLVFNSHGWDMCVFIFFLICLWAAKTSRGGCRQFFVVGLRRSTTWRCWKEEEITIQAIKNVAGAAFSSTPQSFVFLWLLLCHRREMALAALNVVRSRGCNSLLQNGRRPTRRYGLCPQEEAGGGGHSLADP